MRFIDLIFFVLNLVGLVTSTEITSTNELLGETDDPDDISKTVQFIVAASILGLIVVCIICGAIWSHIQRRHQ